MPRKEKASASKAFDRTGAGLISFSAVTTDSNRTTTNSAESAAYEGNNATIGMVFRKAAKRDPTTRVKALQELCQLLNFPADAKASEEQIDNARGLVSHFVYVYLRMCFDSDRQVRVWVNMLLKQVVLVDKRSLGPYMRVLMGPWRMAMCDPYQEAARNATDAFCSAIPPKKRPQVMSYLSASILSYIRQRIIGQADAFVDPYAPENAPQEVVDERCERIIASALNALTRLIKDIKTNQAPENESKTNDIVNGIQDDQTGSSMGLKEVVDLEMMKKTQDQSPVIRRAAYGLLGAVCEHVPDCLEQVPETKLVACACAFSSESYALCIEPMMGALLAIVQAFPQAWHPGNIQKLLPQLLQQIRCGFHGNMDITQMLLPLVGSFKPDVVSLETDGPDNFVHSLVQELGRLATSSSQILIHMDIAEICTYALLRDAQSTAELREKSLSILHSLSTAIQLVILHTNDIEQKEHSRIVLVLSKLHAATNRGMRISTEQWDEFIWTPLTMGIVDGVAAQSERDFNKHSGESLVEHVAALLSSISQSDQAIDVVARHGMVHIVMGLLEAALVPLQFSESTSEKELATTAQWIRAACRILNAFSTYEQPLIWLEEYIQRFENISLDWSKGMSLLIHKSGRLRNWGAAALDDIVSTFGNLHTHNRLTNTTVTSWVDGCLEYLLDAKLILACAFVVQKCASWGLSDSMRQRLRDDIIAYCSAHVQSNPPKQRHIIALAYCFASVDDEFIQQLLDAHHAHEGRVELWTLLSLVNAGRSELPEDVLIHLLVSAYLTRLRTESDLPTVELNSFIKEWINCTLSWQQLSDSLLPKLSSSTINCFSMRFVRH